ncbi:hypothetical protein [Rhizobium rhizosphaerae]|uniref:hypothetical protein n=1 Tax=Xaviernesmea rhizosphaerae TaxID=1672749 RepID=UPI00117B4568|nr:hypothetical protein [Xaviernesmea rhizosphaerae]
MLVLLGLLLIAKARRDFSSSRRALLGACPAAWRDHETGGHFWRHALKRAQGEKSRPKRACQKPHDRAGEAGPIVPGGTRPKAADSTVLQIEIRECGETED